MPHFSHDDANLFYELNGDRGEPLLFIQGVGVIGRGWLPQVEDLTRRHRALTFDNRGIGGSTLGRNAGSLSIETMSEDALAVAGAAGWDSFHVIGHSMGGVIAQCLALGHPGRVRSLVLLCTVARGADAVRMTPAMFVTALRMRIGPRAARRRAFLELIYPATFLAGADTDALAAHVGLLFGRDLADQPPILIKQAKALGRHRGTDDLRALASIPTLVISAALDRITPVRFGRDLAARIPGSRYVEIADAAHGVPIHRAQEINRLIEGFVGARSLDADGPGSRDLSSV